MTYGDFKGLARRTASDKVLRVKAFNTAENLKNDGYQWGLASMGCNFFDKTTSSSSIENKIVLNQELAQELHKPIIRELDKRKVHSSFMDIIWGSDFSDM